MNHQQNPTVDPSVVVHRPETIHSLDNGTLIGELGKKNTYAPIPSSRFLLYYSLFSPTVPVNAMQKSIYPGVKSKMTQGLVLKCGSFIVKYLFVMCWISFFAVSFSLSLKNNTLLLPAAEILMVIRNSFMSALIQGYNLQTCKTHEAGWMALTSFFF